MLDDAPFVKLPVTRLDLMTIDPNSLDGSSDLRLDADDGLASVCFGEFSVLQLPLPLLPDNDDHESDRAKYCTGRDATA